MRVFTDPIAEVLCLEIGGYIITHGGINGHIMGLITDKWMNATEKDAIKYLGENSADSNNSFFELKKEVTK